MQQEQHHSTTSSVRARRNYSGNPARRKASENFVQKLSCAISNRDRRPEIVRLGSILSKSSITSPARSLCPKHARLAARTEAQRQNADFALMPFLQRH